MIHQKRFKAVVPREDVYLAGAQWYEWPIVLTAIYGMAIPFFLLDLCLQVYQATYFRCNQIPCLDREHYIVFDRGRLEGLSIRQKLNCYYCDYANGLMAWARAVVHQTEVYSCAIKHPHSKEFMLQEHYYEAEEFMHATT